MTGVIEGGWEYVIAAYVLTATVFVCWGASIVMLARRGRPRRVREAPPPEDRR